MTLPSLTNYIGMGEADLDYALDFDRIQPGRFTILNMVNPDAVTRLQARSAQRIQKSDEFVKQIQRIERYKKYKDEKSISLNEKEFLARRESDRDAEKEEEKQFDESSEKVDEIFADDFYNKEVTSITLDYLRELADKTVAQTN